MQYGDEKGKVFVGGLSWDTTHGSMLKYFSRYGEVIDCVVMKNPATGKSRGFGFVTFKDPSCVETVLANGPHILDGRQIDPKACNPRSMNKGGKSAENLKRKIFIGGLPANCNEDLLKEFFASYGTVTDVVIMYDQQKQRSRGFGFLTFESEDSVDRVVREHYVHINGKQVECKKAEPRDIKAADGTTLDMTAFPGALALMPQQLAAANALTVNASSIAGFSATAAAAAGTVPGVYQAVPAAQAFSQPGAQSLRLVNPVSPLVTLLDSPYISDPLANTNSPFALAAAGQTPGLIGAYGADASGFGPARALAAAVEAAPVAQPSSGANISFSPSVTYTLAHGVAPVAAGYGMGTGAGFAGASLITGGYAGQADPSTASYIAHASTAIGRITTNHVAQQSFHPYRR